MKAKTKAKKPQKQLLVDGLVAKLNGAQALYYTDFTGLNVKRMTDLRRRLKKAGVEYVVIKNTLALRAVNEAGLAGTRLSGPTGGVVAQDAITAALPTREEALSMFAGYLNSIPMMFALALDARKAQLEGSN